jgi:hypothetical protein
VELGSGGTHFGIDAARDLPHAIAAGRSRQSAAERTLECEIEAAGCEAISPRIPQFGFGHN